VLAEVRLIPNPPARVDNKKIFDLDSFELKLSIIFYLSIMLVDPSRRSYSNLLKVQNSANISNIIVN